MALYILKEFVEGVRLRTHNWKIVGSNPATLIISFLKDPIPGML